MRVLIPCKDSCNPYVSELCQALRGLGLSVDFGLRQFWLNEGEYDIVHLHWPEALFGWKSLDWMQVRSLFHDVLPAWRRTSRIVITRHNAVSHLRDNEYWRHVYSRIFDCVDGVVHLGETGVEQFTRQFSNRGMCHVVIPNQLFATYGDPVDPGAARKRLHIPSRAKVILAFGSIRHDAERRLLLDAFCRLGIRQKLLLAPSFGSPIRPSRRKPLEWLAWELKHHEVLWPQRLRLGNSSVPADAVKLFMSAADVVVIPRLDTLNSGVLPLAFQFGKVVAGPDVGNMGPVLSATGNPTFDPSSTASCAAAMERALALAMEGFGSQNAQYAKKHWGRDKSAELHKKFYESVLERK